MRTLAAVYFGKLVLFLTQFLRLGGGSAAPGLYALKIDPNLVKKLTQKIPKNIVITGTNGKTTTARLLAHFAKEQGLKVIRNHTGSNLERGIASTLIQNWGDEFDLGIWELDEAAFNSVAPKLNPDIIVFLNISRDQLDRYGEIDKVINNWCQTVKTVPKNTTVMINSDDKNLDRIASFFEGRIIRFSLPKDFKLNGLKGSRFKFKEAWVNLKLPGIYHIYDTVAALSLARELKLSTAKCLYSLKTFRPAFGRVERLPFGYIFLIKNPAGATQVFQTLAPNLKPNDRLLLALNDNIADGKDVSWIWDIDLENVKCQMSNVKCFVSGSRANDMALRLKYADFNPIVEPDLEKALKQAQAGLKGQLFILPTYTAMLELQSILAKKGLKKKYWEET